MLSSRLHAHGVGYSNQVLPTGDLYMPFAFDSSTDTKLLGSAGAPSLGRAGPLRSSSLLRLRCGVGLARTGLPGRLETNCRWKKTMVSQHTHTSPSPSLRTRSVFTLLAAPSSAMSELWTTSSWMPTPQTLRAEPEAVHSMFVAALTSRPPPMYGVLLAVGHVEVDADALEAVDQAGDGTVSASADAVFLTVDADDAVEDPLQARRVLCLAGSGRGGGVGRSGTME